MSEVDYRAIHAACDVLQYSGLVAMPTETVYGLAADADNEVAVKKIFAAKNRPSNHPLIVHITGEDDLQSWAKEVPAQALVLARCFWPGPLTMILKKSDRVGDWITGGQDSVGLRAPSNPWARELIKEFAGKNHRGLAAPSANSFGRISPTCAKHVMDDLGQKPQGKVDLILDGGPCDIGVESTIINLTSNPPEILRHGAITRAMLEEALGCAVPDGSANSPRASGTLKSHYAPKTKILLVSDVRTCLQEHAKKRLVVMATPDSLNQTPKNVIKWFASEQTPQAYAHVLYARLHEMDALGADFIVIEQPPQTPQWAAICDRLDRAAA